MNVREINTAEIDSNRYLETMLAVCTNKNKDNEKKVESPNDESHEMLFQPEISSVIKCQDCGSQFSRKDSLTRHIKRNICKSKPDNLPNLNEKNKVLKDKKDDLKTM